MRRRSFLSAIFLTFVSPFAGCASDTKNNNTETPTPSPTPTLTPAPPYITDVQVLEKPEIGELNTIGFEIHLTNLKSNTDYRLRVSVTSEAGTKTVVFDVPSRFGINSDIAGGRMKPAKGTGTDPTELSYQVVLIEEGTDVDTFEGETEYEDPT